MKPLDKSDFYLFAVINFTSFRYVDTILGTEMGLKYIVLPIISLLMVYVFRFVWEKLG